MRLRRALHSPKPLLLVRSLQVNSTHKELYAVCQRLPRGKAPGDDGLPYKFYEAFWEQLASRLLVVPNAAFHSCSTAALPLSMRSERITLLYKSRGAHHIQWCS